MERYTITPPVNGTHTGRYALLQAVSPGGYPNDEDYILLVRRPGELFRPAYVVRVPFDEEPPMLFDYAAKPEVAVVCQDFTLAWTDDGGHTIRTPPRLPVGLFDLWRFGAHRIDRVQIEGDHLYASMAAGRHAPRSAKHEAFVGDGRRMWRLRLDGGSQAAELCDPPVFVSAPAGVEDIGVQGGPRLLMRTAMESAWVEIPHETLLGQLQEAKIDFFGGTGARHLGGSS